MSIKLHDGLRLTEHAPMLDELVREISATIRNTFDQLANEQIARDYAAFFDHPGQIEAIQQKMTERSTLKNKVFYLARQRWISHQSDIDSGLRLHDPLRFEIVFARIDSIDGNQRRLAYPFTESKKYKHALRSMHAVGDAGRLYFADYSYQNQTEPPAGIDEREYLQRRDDWDRVIASNDRRTQDTFAHLPSWSLGNTISDVYSPLRLMEQPAGISKNLNDYLNPATRLDAMLQQQVTDRLVELGMQHQELWGQIMSLGEVIRTARTQGLLDDLDGPAALPETIDSHLLVDDLPQPYQVPAELVEQLAQHVLATTTSR